MIFILYKKTRFLHLTRIKIRLCTRFVCDGTIEERICTLQEKKMAMASDMLNGVRHTSASKLTIDDMKALFDM